VSLVEELAARYGYPIGDIGIYIQPIEHNRACRPEFSFFYDPENQEEKGGFGVFTGRPQRCFSMREPYLPDLTEIWHRLFTNGPLPTPVI
jgi:hypothetical protein